VVTSTNSITAPVPAAPGDGVVPVYNPNGRWTTWALQELYLGTIGTNRYVPKVNDYVVDYTTDEWWIVDSVDPTTYVPTLKAIRQVITPADIDTTDLLYAAGPGTPGETYRAYIDKSVMPYKLSLDQRSRVYSVLTKYAKIFQGSKLNGTDKVVSAYYDASGNFLGENIPLVLAAQETGVNYAVKTVPSCYTKVDIEEGEILTAVLYDDEGGVVSTRQYLAVESTFIRSTDAAAKYVTGISLESPFLSESNPNLIEYPLNVPLAGFNMWGVVHYSDGSKKRMPVDGTKFTVMGFAPYVATVVGQKFNFTLKYTLASDEIVYMAQGLPTGDKFITAGYQAITTNVDGSYTLKLYCVPVWIPASNNYRLDWYLYNLDRTIAINVTAYIKYATNIPGFDPAAYGVNQQVQVSVNLNDVNAVYKKFIFTQTLSITLYRQATDHTGNPWVISYDPGQDPPYGKDLKASVTFVNQDLKYVNIGQGLTDQAAWLAKVLDPAKPLYDNKREASYPTPNMFSFIQSDGTEVEFQLSQWNAANVVSGSVPDGATLYVKFFKRTPDNDLQIALCPMVIQQTS
jgi:hypothetical protein